MRYNLTKFKTLFTIWINISNFSACTNKEKKWKLHVHFLIYSIIFPWSLSIWQDGLSLKSLGVLIHKVITLSLWKLLFNIISDVGTLAKLDVCYLVAFKTYLSLVQKKNVIYSSKWSKIPTFRFLLKLIIL